MTAAELQARLNAPAGCDLCFPNYRDDCPSCGCDTRRQARVDAHILADEMAPTPQEEYDRINEQPDGPEYR